MIKNKKGLSAIVTTLLVILLVLVAVGIVWGVVGNVLKGGASQLDVSSKCLNVEVQAISTTCGAAAGCTAVIERTGSSSETIAGIKVVAKDTATGGSSSVIDLAAMNPLETATATFTDAPVPADLIEATAYFEDSSGADVFCPQPGQYSFTP
jgi:flagellin-like protein